MPSMRTQRWLPKGKSWELSAQVAAEQALGKQLATAWGLLEASIWRRRWQKRW
jgi:hypothetical protein